MRVTELSVTLTINRVPGIFFGSDEIAEAQSPCKHGFVNSLNPRLKGRRKKRYKKLLTARKFPQVNMGIV